MQNILGYVVIVLLVVSAPVMAAWNKGDIKWAQLVLLQNGFYRGTVDGRWSAELEDALQAATRDFDIPYATDISQEKRDVLMRIVLSLYDDRHEYDLATRKASKSLSILPTLPPPGIYIFINRETGEFTHIVHKDTWSFFPDGKCQWRRHFINETNSAVNKEASLLGHCQLVKWGSDQGFSLYKFQYDRYILQIRQDCLPRNH
jgi:hypothetical protein